MIADDSPPEGKDDTPAGEKPPKAPETPAAAPEIGGRSGPEPTRYGDWEVKGICSDF